MPAPGITLNQILALVGPLGDGAAHDRAAHDPAADRLRQFLRSRVATHERLTEFIDEARQKAGQNAP
jgi:hypothetical protein